MVGRGVTFFWDELMYRALISNCAPGPCVRQLLGRYFEGGAFVFARQSLTFKCAQLETSALQIFWFAASDLSVDIATRQTLGP